MGLPHCVLVFDIESVPDVDTGRRLYGLTDLSDAQAAKAMLHIRRQETGQSDFMRHHLHQIMAISVVLRNEDGVKLWSLGGEQADEKTILKRFFDGIDQYTPTLVSWNGRGFDMPVICYRAIKHAINAQRYWEMGQKDQSFRWNNYLNRYHERHLDLMDMLSAYQPRLAAPLDQMALMLGFPGKMAMSGEKVLESWLAGDITTICNYCETDVLNTYLIYLRFELMRGHIDQQQYQVECEQLAQVLSQLAQPHLQQFLRHWEGFDEK